MILGKHVKSVVGQVVFKTYLERLVFRGAAVVVTFHRVNDRTDDDGLTCGIKMFQGWCRFLRDEFHVISLRDMIGKLRRGMELDRELAITFDDGYADNYECAAGVLNSSGLPATFFIVSQFIDKEVVPWWDARRGLRFPWMTWDQVRELRASGFEIGAHTRTHVNLGEVSGDEARNEIIESRLELEEKLGGRVTLFAYPYGGPGHMTEENREIVKAAGFECCCSCFGGVNNRETDPFHLRRIPISSWYRSPYEWGCEVALRRA